MRRTKVFVVDDEILILMSLQATLAELDYDVVGTAASLGEGVRKAGTLEADVAIVDLTIAGRKADPIIDVLVRRNIPVVASSGHDLKALRDKDGWSDGWSGHVLLQKPYTSEQLQSALKSALKGKSDKAGKSDKSGS